jgi:tRNA U34 2-thiouridine synthase MnmA/TrmU
VEVIAVTFLTAFMSSEKAIEISADICNKFGIKHKIIDLSCSKEYLNVIEYPAFGYGKNMNPCIDCHIFMLKKAKKIMKEEEAEFIVTGEIVGERPMSQRKNILKMIDQKASLKGLVLRPLSAGLLKETIAESKGWVRRQDMLNISGRSRRPQLRLAKKMQIKSYLTPAGGCLLTDREYSKKIKDLLKFKQLTLDQLPFLKVGRHFRLSKKVKLMVGRNKEENKRLKELKKDSDIFLLPSETTGPSAVLRGCSSEKVIKKAASIVIFYTKSNKKEVIKYYKLEPTPKKITVYPIDKKNLEKLRI